MTPAFFGFDEEDTRTVQTAVRGGPDSGIPEFLPYEKHAANQLREKYGPNAFSCGVLLGGCGKLLTLRACDDKKSHFAHRPPVRCTRSARGEDSADHLYIGEALNKWLRAQGRPNIVVNYVKQKSARSDTIEIRFGSKKKKRLIHVQMARRSFKEWEQDGARLTASAGKPSTLRMYGPESQLSAFELEATGHALRFRCATVNGTRVVHIGTHLPGHQVEWTTLERCRLVPAGIVTPWLEETPYGIQPKGAAAPRKPAASTAGPRTPAPVEPASAAPAPEATGAASAPAGPALPLRTGSLAFTGATLLSEENGRRLYDVDAQPVGSVLFRAHISLPASAAAPEPHHVYVLTERAAVLGGPQNGDPASQWILRAEGFVRLTAQRAVEWELLKPPGPVSKTPADAREANEERNGASSEAAIGGPRRESSSQPQPDAQKALATPSAGPSAPVSSPDDRLAAELGRVLLAEQVRGDMGPVYALHLSPRDRKAATGLMREFKQWVRDREPKPSAGPAQEPLNPLADRVRTVLQDVARAGTTITWEGLRHRVGGDTSPLHPRHQGEILMMADRDTPADEPLLSTLVAGADLSPDGLYPHIRHSLGRKRVPDPSIEMHWRMDVLRLHQLWRHR